MEKEDDLPKSIIVILVILAVAISVLGTITVITEMNRLDITPVSKDSPVQNAKISLTVERPDDTAAMAEATGKITFTYEPEAN